MSTLNLYKVRAPFYVNYCTAILISTDNDNDNDHMTTDSKI